MKQTLLSLKLKAVEVAAVTIERAKNHVQASTRLAAIDKGPICFKLSSLRGVFVEEVEQLETDYLVADLIAELMSNVNTVMKTA